VTWQTPPGEGWPQDPGQGGGADQPDRPGLAGRPGQPASFHVAPGWRPEGQPTGPRGRRKLGRIVAFALLFAVGLGGLAVSAVGIAHQLLPRQFTAAQRREITAWEVERRWRALPSSAIFPDRVRYVVPSDVVDATSELALAARRLSIGPQTGCAAALSAATARILTRYGCTAVLRATYVDASGSMVATIAVAVLPGSAAASTALNALDGANSGVGKLIRAMRVPGTPAAGFGQAQRQVSNAVDAGPYLILSTAGFAEGGHRGPVAIDSYLDQEMTAFASGLVSFASRMLGHLPPTPACPGTPGC
jgi:hypothetical protein